jgi:hypothetical protein
MKRQGTADIASSSVRYGLMEPAALMKLWRVGRGLEQREQVSPELTLEQPIDNGDSSSSESRLASQSASFCHVQGGRVKAALRIRP